MTEPTDTAAIERPAPVKLEDVLAGMRTARAAFQAGTLSEADYVDRILQLDRSLTTRLAGPFNAHSGFAALESEFVAALEARSNAAPGFYAPENETRSRREILGRLIENHPQLAGMTVADAASIVDRTSRGEEIEWKYGNADALVVLSAAMTMVNINREQVARLNPGLHRALDNSAPTYLGDVIGQRLMARAETDDAFEDWESGKRDEVLAALRGNEALMTDIGRLRPLLDSANEQEFLEQHRLRESITQRMAGIYARVYGVPELGNGNVATVYAPAEAMQENETYGYAGGVHGIRGEEHVVLRTTLYPELLYRNPTDTPRAVAEKFLLTVNEEMRHAVDGLYADRLVNDTLPEDHPAFRHTNIIFFNHFNYTNHDETYARQYLERTAKEAAMEVTLGLLDQTFPQPKSTARTQGPVVELPGMTIQAGAKP